MAKATTVIGSSIVIDGEVTGDEELVVLGTIKGRIVLKEGLIVEASGTVEADVETHTVRIAGKIKGNIVATEKVEILAGGKVFGDIKAPRILISDGAVFKGSVDMVG